MMTVLELINALENARGDYDDPVIVIAKVIGMAEKSYNIEYVELDAGGPGGEPGYGHLRLVVSRRAA